jgi:hypothetical protein
LIRRFLLLVALALPLTLVAGSAQAVPGQITWIDSGQRSGGMITFTAASPLCPSGTVRDIGGTTGIKMEHTCADGSGTFEFEVVGTGRFHFSAAGTGRYSTLRGTGSCSVTQNDDGTFTRIATRSLTSTALPRLSPSRPWTSYSQGVGSISRPRYWTTDNVAGNAVKYRVSVTAAGHALGHTTGTTPGGTVRVSVAGRLPKRAHRLTVSLRVVDPLGNARTVTRSGRIPC